MLSNPLRLRLKWSTKLLHLVNVQLSPVATAGDGRYVGIDYNYNCVLVRMVLTWD